MSPSSILTPEEIRAKIREAAADPVTRARAEAFAKLTWKLRGGGSSAESDFTSFVGKANPRFQWYRHCEVVGAALEKVARGELKRLMVFEPPRHGKSEEVSRLFPAYYLRKFPHHWVGLASYSADLAYTFSRAARQNYIQGGLARELGDTSAVKHWETGKGGGLWATGVGGPITGKGANLGLIDDPIKNQEEAASVIVRESHKDWYRSTFYTRLEPDAAIVITLTRWHEDDLAGWLLNEDEQEGGVEPWHIIDLPARYEGPRYDYPAICTVEPDWREVGEPLCPERYPEERLKAIEQAVGTLWWASLYRQRPGTVVDKGRVYYNVGSKNIQPVKDLGGDLWVGMDFNVNPMVAVIASKAGDELHCFDEVVIEDSGTEEMAQELERRYPRRSIHVCPDPSGNSRKTSAPIGDTDFAILRRHRFTIHAPSAAPLVADRVNEVNALAGEEGKRARLFLDPKGCAYLAKCLRKLGYKPGTGVVDKGRGLDHGPDALGYLVHHLFPIVVNLHWSGQRPFGG